MAEAVYAIEDFPDDDLHWRIEWIGGVGYNTSVSSDPQIEICLAQLPAGERPLRRKTEARSQRSYAHTPLATDKWWPDACPRHQQPPELFHAFALVRSISSKGLRLLNRFAAPSQASSGMEARSGVHAARSPGVRSAAASESLNGFFGGSSA
jgi:hypothetical protein